MAADDLRPVAWLEDVSGVDVDHAVFPHAAGVPTFVLKDVTGLVIRGSNGLPETNRPEKISGESL